MGYTVKVYLNGIHWDDSYTNDRAEAEEWKKQFEDNSISICDRVNTDALVQFIRMYDIGDEEYNNEEHIEVTADIVED